MAKWLAARWTVRIITANTSYWWAVATCEAPTVTPPPPPTTFGVGVNVQPTAIVNVRATAAGALLGTQAVASPGVILAGPIVAAFNGVDVTWWNINFTAGVDGWVGEGDLILR